MPDPVINHLTRLQKMLSDQAQLASTAHGQFLQLRQVSLEQMEKIIDLQMGNEAQLPAPTPAPTPIVSSRRDDILFDTSQLVEFATGSMARCFGPEFNLFEGRRYPRIPNGDLLLMSRVTAIHGQRSQFSQPADINVEYDVPADAWYFRDNAYSSLPYSVWMEIALQPCGFLSAYLGTSLIFPQMDFFFRNLDGSSQILNNMDVRGKTLLTHARLLSTIASDNTIIQKFDFDVSCEGQPVFKGQSVFGFFPPEVMAKQAGLDSGKTRPPVFEGAQPAGDWVNLYNPLNFTALPGQPHYRLSDGQLNFLDRIFIPQDPQKFPIYAQRDNQPNAWFYPCHFYQDAVMPGSLGVEAMIQALQAYAINTGLGKRFMSPHFELAPSVVFQWKYRGQILPTHQRMRLEVTPTGVEAQADCVILTANASLWADAVRIYEVKQLAICLCETI
jgi:3-hydroxymyristoyl/3-hydroxydecanoyl-(acyl carrier protein) dehydratase